MIVRSWIDNVNWPVIHRGSRIPPPTSLSVNLSLPKPQNVQTPKPRIRMYESPISPVRQFHYSLMSHPRSDPRLPFPPPTRMNAPTAILRFTRTQYRHSPIEGWQPESGRDKLMSSRFGKKKRKGSARSVKARMCTKGRKIERNKVSVTLAVPYRFLFVCLYWHSSGDTISKIWWGNALVVAAIHCLHKRNWY